MTVGRPDPSLDGVVPLVQEASHRSRLVSNSNSLTGRDGSCTAWRSNRVSRSARAWTVAASNRSTAYSKVPPMPAGGRRRHASGGR